MSADHLYLDLQTVNNDQDGSAPKQTLVFSEQRQNPLIANPSDYYLSCVRFNLDTALTLPLFQPVLLIDGVNTDPNKLSYCVTISQPQGGLITNSKTVYVQWRAEDATAALPNNGLGSGGVLTAQDYNTGYYNGYSVRWFLNLVNEALLAAWTLIYPANPNLAPNFVVDPLSAMFTLLTPVVDFPSGQIANCNFAFSENAATGIGPAPLYTKTPIYLGVGAAMPVAYNLWMNETLYNLFCGQLAVYYGNSLVRSNFDIPPPNLYAYNYLILPINYRQINQITVNSIQWIQSTSELSSVPLWACCQSIAFNTTTIPIAMSNATVPTVYNNSTYDQTIRQSGNNSQFSAMLSDIAVGLISGLEQRPTVDYLPSSEYRMTDLLSNMPISQISFTVSWKNKFGALVPFRLCAQGGAAMKLLFRRKRFNVGNLAPYDS